MPPVGTQLRPPLSGGDLMVELKASMATRATATTQQSGATCCMHTCFLHAAHQHPGRVQTSNFTAT
jgi:hypothetical protein